MTVSISHDIDAWREVSTAHFVQLDCQTAASDFTATIDTQPLSTSMSVSRIQSGPVRIDRTARMATVDARDDLLMTVQLAGVGTVSQFNRTAVLQPGSASLYDPRHAYRLSMPRGGQDLLVLRIPRSSLGMTDTAIEHLGARPLTRTAPGMAAFGGFLAGMLSPGGSLDGVRPEFAVVTEQLLATVIRASLVDAPIARAEADPGALLAALRARIASRALDPTFDVTALARDSFVSVRTVHAAFEAVGETPGAFIRATRLRHAASELRDATLWNVPVHVIGERAGFRDASTFTRAFRKHFGVTPGDWRHDASIREIAR
ncbi:helix-turn-helix transcriptional regulator [Gulosibacter molinativorax]|uniref:helix-turn-helix transcriptional regulator n=1 Tax=Gulosibacter molinativorax TaxID=256821 RepID=UPI000424289D|nr:AraC family transcriptional regulator [Gulosibacter molinativorax]QUY62922.1 Hypotetical protein [Gulosibacter molinativorax]